jgi:hypothetical protein
MKKNKSKGRKNEVKMQLKKENIQKGEFVARTMKQFV